ncbi:unnamed protein product [Boreogadus saida]
MLTMQRGPGEQTKHKMHLAKALCNDLRGGGLNRGQKSSAPLDVMLEELQLPTNRGSRMFQERQKRVEHFTLEHAANGSNTGRVLPPQPAPEPQPGKENLLTPRVGKHSLVLSLQKTIAKKGNPEVLAPGYSGPLQGVPCERFNSTVTPRSYSSPWRGGGGHDQRTLATLTEHLPKPPEPPTFRCFNRSALPFGGPMTSRRVIPVMSCEALGAQRLPASSRDCMSRRGPISTEPQRTPAAAVTCSPASLQTPAAAVTCSPASLQTPAAAVTCSPASLQTPAAAVTCSPAFAPDACGRSDLLPRLSPDACGRSDLLPRLSPDACGRSDLLPRLSPDARYAWTCAALFKGHVND